MLRVVKVYKRFPTSRLGELVPDTSCTRGLVASLGTRRLVHARCQSTLENCHLAGTTGRVLLSISPLHFRYCLANGARAGLVQDRMSQHVHLRRGTRACLALLRTKVPFCPSMGPSVFYGRHRTNSVNVQDLPLFCTSERVGRLNPRAAGVEGSHDVNVLVTPRYICILCGAKGKILG